jgi:hypothetical protein
MLALAACSTEGPPRTAAPAPSVRITQFYASPPKPARGEQASLCYGVENASEVRLDPPVEKVWPAMSRCFPIATDKPVTYTLTASRGEQRVTQSVTVAPGPPAVKIIEVSINRLEVSRGEDVTVCYKVKNAATVTVTPGAWINPHDARFGCVRDQPKQATTYVVTATGPDGNTDTERVTAKVK